MQFDLVLENIDLPFYLGYVPVDLPVELRNGKLSLNLNILYRITAESGGELELQGRVDLFSLDIWDRLHEQLFFLPLLRVEIAPSQPLKQEIHLLAVRAYNLEVQLKRDQQGDWNHARMAPTGAKQAPPEEKGEESTPFKLMVDALEIHDGVVVFKDNFPAGGFDTVAREINLDVRDFALDAKQGIPLDISLETDRNETLTINGQLLLEPFTLALQAELQNISMASYMPYYQDAYSVPLGGRADLQAKLMINPEQPMLISDGMIKWRDAYMAFNDHEGMGIALIDINNLSFDLGKNRLEVGSTRYEDGLVNFSRNAEGHWSFLSSNFPLLAKLTEVPDEEPYQEAKFPKPRSFIGMTKKLPEAEMEKLIYANTSVTEDQLADLAQTRALTVQTFLFAEGQLPQERIFLKKSDITAAPEQETAYRARVELGAAVR